MKQLNEYVEYTIAQYVIKPRYRISNKVLLEMSKDFDYYKVDDIYWQTPVVNLNIFTDIAVIKLGHNLPPIWYSRPSAIEHDKFNNLNPAFRYLYSYNENGIFIALKLGMLNWRGISMNPSKKAISLLKKNMDKIDFSQLNLNSNKWAVKFLKNPIFDTSLASYNSNEEIVNWFLENQDKIDWANFSMNTNPKAIELFMSKGYKYPSEIVDIKFTNQLYKLFGKLIYEAKF